MTSPAASSPGERVEAYLRRVGLSASSIRDLPGDASDRRYVRVRLADGTTRMMLVHSGPIDPTTLPWLNVAQLFRQLSIPIPRVHDTAPDLGILVLEDLGDATLQSSLGTATGEQVQTLYEDAIGLIVRMQRHGRELASSGYLPFSRSFDAGKLSSELEFFSAHYLGDHLQADLAPARREALSTEFRHLAESLAAEPRVLCHRDYHSRNLMVREGKLHVIDFQDARLGPDTYDLVSLLRDCYVSLPEALFEGLMDTYHRLTGSTISPSDPNYRDRFDRMSVQRHLKALGTFGYQAAVVGNADYLSDVPRTIGYLADVFSRRSDFGGLRRLLAAHIPELG